MFSKQTHLLNARVWSFSQNSTGVPSNKTIVSLVFCRYHAISSKQGMFV
jgi:hypothetical protein